MSNQPISVVFFGTPAAAVPSLNALASNPAFKVAAVVTQPDRPAGRGQQLTASPVSEAAQALGLRTIKPESLKGISGNGGQLVGTAQNSDLVEFLNSQPAFDLFVVVAFGQIIPKSMIALPRAGIINAHFSLLPRWRGAAPIQRALAAGDEKTGVAIMRIEPGLDTGPVYAVEEIKIESNDNFGSIHDRLSVIGAELLSKTLPQIAAGEIEPKIQDHSKATHAAKWEKPDMRIVWSEPAAATVNRIRASSPNWGVRASLGGEPVKIFAASISPIANGSASSTQVGTAPGTVAALNRSEIIIRAGDGQGVAITEIQFAGKRRLLVKDYLAGNPIPVGTKFDDGQ